MNADQLITLAPVAVPAATALIGLFVPSPGPTIARYSAAWWASLVETLAKVWESKPVQAEVALEVSPAMQAVINQAVATAVAAIHASQTPANVWLSQPGTVTAPTP
jgi:hypothetical protein